MKINFSSKSYLILIIAFSSLILWPVFLPGYFFHHDDLQVMRIFEMKKCFEDLQIPCRWVPDMGYGNGFPLFNYYSALPYYIGASLSYGMGLINAAKALFFIPLLLGGISMFLLGQKLFNKESGFLAGMLYAFAPYRALDSYVRGAIAESFALALIPLVFYFVIRIIEKPSRQSVILGSLSLGAFLLCHNIMTMFFMPFVGLFGLILLYFNKWENWRALFLSAILGIGVSAFFLLPVFTETGLVHTETLTQGGSNFRTHFVTVSQIFLDRTWGYGGSQFGPNDTISFQIGWPHWWFVVIALPFLWISYKKNKKLFAVAVFLLAMFFVSIFMMHNKSAFIWEMINSLQYAQFPWRFLSLSIFSTSLLAGFCFYFFEVRFKNLLLWLVVLLNVFLNWNFFIPRDFYPWINDTNKLQDPLWEIQQKAGILDYLPKTAYEPFGRAPNAPEIITGNAETQNYNVRSNKFSFNTRVTANAYEEIPVFDFPNWVTYINGKEYPHDHQNHLGRIGINLTPGDYQVTGIFKNTPVRTIGNIVTLLSFLILLFLTFDKRIYKKL